MELKIKFKTIHDIMEFIEIANKVNFDIDIHYKRFVLNAKSIMAIFSIDLKHGINIELHTDRTQALNFAYKIKKYLSKESKDILKEGIVNGYI